MRDDLHLYCFDPGGTTGFAEMTASDSEGVIRILRGCEIPTFEGLERLFPPVAIGFTRENFTIILEQLSSQHPSFLTIGLEVAGAIRYLAYVYRFELVLRPPSMMVAAQRIHPLTEIKSPHIRDAVHHGISYVYQSFHRSFEVIIREGSSDAKKDSPRH